MKILFLDFDGVLNGLRYLEEISTSLSDADFVTRSARLLDRKAVERVNEIVRRTGAQVVVSSTWRIRETAASMQELLRSAGFDGEVIGVTPRIHEGSRGDEITAWLDGEIGSVTFAILDDGCDMGPLIDHLVQTRSEDGLTDSEVEKVVALLREND